MKVILKDDVENLGRLGDVKDVAPGYARNYLIPRGLVTPATSKNLARVKHERRLIEAKLAARRSESEALAKKVNAAKVSIPVRVGPDGKLFGSVTARDIAGALEAQGISVGRRNLFLDAPIKSVGDRDVKVELDRDVTATLKLSVVPESEGESVVEPVSEAVTPEAASPEEVSGETAEQAASDVPGE